MKSLLVPVLLLGLAAPAAAQYAVTPQKAPAVPEPPSACQLRLGKLAQFESLPVLAGPAGCGARDAVVLHAVFLADRSKVAVVPPATLRCTMAEAVVLWLREDVAPAVKKLGAALRGIDNADSYDCRSRNRVVGAMLSEHGRANAFDVGGLKLADRRTVKLTDVEVAKDWREIIKASACARFATVLGPGSDGYHEEHVHVDLAERRGGYKMCEWEVRTPVLQARAPEATTRVSDAATGRATDAAADAVTRSDVARIQEPVPLPRPRPIPGRLAAAKPLQLHPPLR